MATPPPPYIPVPLLFLSFSALGVCWSTNEKLPIPYLLLLLPALAMIELPCPKGMMLLCRPSAAEKLACPGIVVWGSGGACMSTDQRLCSVFMRPCPTCLPTRQVGTDTIMKAAFGPLVASSRPLRIGDLDFGLECEGGKTKIKKIKTNNKKIKKVII